MTEWYKCDCYLCSKHREITKAIHEQDVKTLGKLAEELCCRAMSAEFDRDYYAAIFDGTWPNAVEILEKALIKAKSIKAEAESQAQNPVG